jgi:hypothetical protein
MHFGLKIVFAKCAFYDLEFIMINKNDKKNCFPESFLYNHYYLPWSWLGACEILLSSDSHC